MTDFEKRVKILAATALVNQRIKPKGWFKYFAIRTADRVIVLRSKVDKDDEIT